MYVYIYILYTSLSFPFDLLYSLHFSILLGNIYICVIACFLFSSSSFIEAQVNSLLLLLLL